MFQLAYSKYFNAMDYLMANIVVALMTYSPFWQPNTTLDIAEEEYCWKELLETSVDREVQKQLKFCLSLC